MENGLISQIVQDDQSFIQEIQNIDNHLTHIAKNIKSSRAQLTSDNLLKEMIIFYSKDTASALQS